MDTEQEEMWEALKTLPYNYTTDGVSWNPPVKTLNDLKQLSGEDGDVVLVLEHGLLYMSISDQWNKI